MTVDRLSNELVKPLDAINESTERVLDMISKITSAQIPACLELKKIDSQIQYA